MNPRDQKLMFWMVNLLRFEIAALSGLGSVEYGLQNVVLEATWPLNDSVLNDMEFSYRETRLRSTEGLAMGFH